VYHKEGKQQKEVIGTHCAIHFYEVLEECCIALQLLCGCSLVLQADQQLTAGRKRLLAAALCMQVCRDALLLPQFTTMNCIGAVSPHLTAPAALWWPR
jgi:hypothetical protein